MLFFTLSLRAITALYTYRFFSSINFCCFSLVRDMILRTNNTKNRVHRVQQHIDFVDIVPFHCFVLEIRITLTVKLWKSFIYSSVYIENRNLIFMKKEFKKPPAHILTVWRKNPSWEIIFLVCGVAMLRATVQVSIQVEHKIKLEIIEWR